LGLVKALALREDAIVFAGARNPKAADELQAFASTHSEKVHIVQLVSSDKPGNEAAIAEIQRKIGRLDVVIANAGMMTTVIYADFRPISDNSRRDSSVVWTSD
jgi:NAD(P)-dependent dehydrogenase (short-subunit alcohol dehydrogenase family)